MPAGHSPSIRGRQLIAELKRLREAAQLTQEQVAERLDWHQTKVFRIETGRTTPHPNDVRLMVELYGVTEPGRRDGLVQLAKDARKRGWWYAYRDVVPHQYEIYIGLESEATSVRNFDLASVPGLLQTADYAHALIQGGPQDLDDEETSRRVEVRMIRQKILDKADRPQLWVVIDESVIQRSVGGSEVMRAQLHHLLDVSEHPKTSVQVIPYRRGAHPGMVGSFSILGFHQHTDLDVVNVETIGGNLYVADPMEVLPYANSFDHLMAEAENTDRSRIMIESALKNLT
ncbi:helix-turn-helix transcriptional regulator [Actinoallomurus sp. NPDC052308]|uniref:helix-turn-helix domain-containing protein n=1 Tax=Actinoallomurus sp. NPDC052308 TaxID=3155530 RepID=UPI00344A3BC9